jgi:hypothetical protein
MDDVATGVNPSSPSPSTTTLENVELLGEDTLTVNV